MKLEGSLFNGREPDEARWGIDRIKLDSYSGRVTVNPGMHWSMTAGYGYLKSPEALHPDEPMHRTTASVLYSTHAGPERHFATAFIWGANKHAEHKVSHSFLAEAEASLDQSNTLLAKLEYVQKSGEDLVLPPAFDAEERHGISQLSVGYIREVSKQLGTTLGLGVRGSVAFLPDELEPVYESRTPLGLFVFARLRPLHNHNPEMAHSTLRM